MLIGEFRSGLQVNMNNDYYILQFSKQNGDVLIH